MKNSITKTLHRLQADSTAFFTQLAEAVAPYPVPFAHTLKNHGNTAKPSLCAVIVAVLITTQTTDSVSERAFHRLMAAAGGMAAADLRTLSAQRIEQALREVNYYRTKAARIKRIAEYIDGRAEEEVLGESFLLSLPGVGRKIANLVRGIWMERASNTSDRSTADSNAPPPGIAVDTHLLRIFYRLGVTSSERDAAKTERELAALFPAQQWVALNDYGVRFGQHICTARQPHCTACPFNAHCPKRGMTEHE